MIFPILMLSAMAVVGNGFSVVSSPGDQLALDPMDEIRDSWTSIRAARQADPKCPVVFAKPQAECSGKASNCWSPGVPDVDCDGDLCCFNGCVNECVAKAPVCTVTYETKYENVTKEECKVEEIQVEECVDVTKEECKQNCTTQQVETPPVVPDECHNVEDCHEQTTVVCEEQACYMDNVPVCAPEETEVCHEEPEQTCSTVVEDTDLPVNTTICMKNRVICMNMSRTECKPVVTTIDVCNNVTVTKCSPEQAEICIDVTGTKCEFGSRGPACFEEIEQVCHTEDEVDTACTTVPEQQCMPQGPDMCTSNHTFTKVPMKREKCVEVIQKVCKPISNIVCKIKEVEVCPDCINKTQTQQVCQVKRECTKATIDVPETKEVCQKICQPIVVQDCKLRPQSKLNCAPVTVQMSFQVPVQNCV